MQLRCICVFFIFSSCICMALCLCIHVSMLIPEAHRIQWQPAWPAARLEARVRSTWPGRSRARREGTRLRNWKRSECERYGVMIKLTRNGSNGEHVDGKRFVVPDGRKNRHLGEVLLQAVGDNLEINLFTEDSGNIVRYFDNELCNWD